MEKIEPITYNELKRIITNLKYCDKIKEHTVDKINYIKEYVTNWLYVMSQYSNEVYFIDCMSNSGIYKNEYLCSCIEVLQIFYSFAINHPSVNFYLFCNDYDNKKIEILNEIINYLKNKYHYIRNVKIIISNMDATKYINQLTEQLNNNIKKSILLYVDPYNFVTKELLDALFNFTTKIYSELILNFFSSDVTRNISNEFAYKKKESLNKVVTNYTPYEEDEKISANQLMYSVIDRFTESTKLKYKYFFQIKNSKNVEQYYLIYFSPNLKGLIKLKNAVWKLYGPSTNNKKINIEIYNYDLFGNTSYDYIKNDNLNKVKNYLNQHVGNCLSFSEIEKIVLESTIFNDSHVITEIITPLIQEGVLIKLNLISARNYKKDSYRIEKQSVLKGLY